MTINDFQALKFRFSWLGNGEHRARPVGKIAEEDNLLVVHTSHRSSMHIIIEFFQHILCVKIFGPEIFLFRSISV